MTNQLRQRGYRLVEFGQPTDLLVVNTCSVTENAEKDCRYAVRSTLRHSPQAFVAVTGCYAQTGMEALRTIPGIDLIVGTQYKMQLPEFLPAPQVLHKQPVPEVQHTRQIDREDFLLPGIGESDSTRAPLKIQDGCNFMCSFCLIPFARGRERSRVLRDIIREAHDLVKLGHRELVLTGVNIGRYAYEGLGLLDVIERLEVVEGLDRVRISSIEPTTVTDDLLADMASSRKLCPYLHIPLQSGDDRILAAMNRHYTAADYVRLIERAVKRIPDLGLGTDLMVGFPGEGEAEFQQTVQVASDLPFTYFHVFSFSRRPGTAAWRTDGTVPAPVVKARSAQLAALSRAKRLVAYQRYVGRTVEVLFEQRGDHGRWTGVTGNFMKVGVLSDHELTNTFQEVTVTGVMDGLALGHLLPATAPPPSLTLI